MAERFKVWATVEVIREEQDQYLDVGEPVPIGEFESFEQANDFLASISTDGVGAKSSDVYPPAKENVG